jgi:superfamily II DNA or RNA helicase
MLKLEEITKGIQIAGLVPGELVNVVSADSFGESLKITYSLASGGVSETLLNRSDEERLSKAEMGLAWSFDSDPGDFRRALEAFRIRLGFLFDRMTAIHSSLVEPLPHQISAVYDRMLKQNPLRFVLADDPGAGKTIMAGLLIKELLIRSDTQRILILVPGALVDQWQEEMLRKFGIRFETFISQGNGAGNFFNEQNLVILRLDQFARNEELKSALEDSTWDLVVADEAHRLSAHRFSSSTTKKTKRYKLAELLARNSRHFLMMTATPHSGNNADFHLWLSLLDPDRFYLGSSPDEPAVPEVSDVMRRMVKEDLRKFDGSPLFPERRAETILFPLSEKERDLYGQVTEYVRSEMNRAERLQKQERNNLGFALTILQRRLASSPQAIYESLQRRRRFLEKDLQNRREHPEKYPRREPETAPSSDLRAVRVPFDLFAYDTEKEDDDFYDPDDEQNADYVVAERSIDEVEKEIETVDLLVAQAKKVVDSDEDCKWNELSKTLQKPQFVGPDGKRLKLIIFTEYRDTLDYLERKIKNLLGVPEAVLVIHGGIKLTERNEIQENFRNDPDVSILIATDAAGEGVNLQRAHLMINYDIPWNPNRLEQRFGRIHRIGQTERCFMWNMVAEGTREGEVFRRLFLKLEAAREKLGGRVFDILGKVFDKGKLNQLLIQAIMQKESPEDQNKINKEIDGTLDPAHLNRVIRENALVQQAFTPETLYSVKAEMDKAEARKLQPCYVRNFFTEAFQRYGGEIRRREEGRYELPFIPPAIRNNQKTLKKIGGAIAKKYDRICFEKEKIRVAKSGRQAEYLHPGHPLVRSLTDLILENHSALLKPGTVMFDPSDDGTEPSLIFMIDHSVTETLGGNEVSRRLQFVRIRPDGSVENAGWAPHLDLEPPSDEVLKIAEEVKKESWLNRDIEKLALDYAIPNLCTDHFQEVRQERRRHVDKTLRAVKERLTQAIKGLERRILVARDEVKRDVQIKVNLQNLEKTFAELRNRLETREKELEQMRSLSNKPPVVMGGILLIPKGLLDKKRGIPANTADAEARKAVEAIAMNLVMETERSFGHTVIDVSAEKCGWDITARPTAKNPDGSAKEDRHIEVKGRRKDAPTILFTHNEVVYAMNQQDKFILAIVLVDGDKVEGPFYLRCPFSREPDFGVASENRYLDILLDMAVAPEETL